MNAILTDILATARVTTPSGEHLPLHSHLPPLEGELLQAWIRTYRPARLLEIGLAYGISSLFIWDAVADWPIVRYDIIDPNQREQWRDVGRYNLDRAGCGGRYTLYEAPSECCLPDLLKAGAEFDFAFIDGCHLFDHALVDFFYVNRMLAVGGMVVFDDANRPAIQQVAAHVRTLPCYAELQLPDAFARRIDVRVRQMMHTPPARIIGFHKRAPDERNEDGRESA